MSIESISSALEMGITNDLTATLDVSVGEKVVVDPVDPVKPPLYVKVIKRVKKILKWFSRFF